MKFISKNIFVFLLSLMIVMGNTSTAEAQTATKAPKGMEQTVSFKVTGICQSCKARIESTAMDVKGVKKAEWDIKTDVLVLVGSSKMDKQKVANALAKAGHKSELAAADPKGYANLPGCCQYDSGIEKH